MDSKALIQIRREFFSTVKKHVESITGIESKELATYRQRYEKELNQLPWVSVDKRHFFARLKKADIILVGDFHAQKQSTRGFLRIVRKLKGPLVLALECLPEKSQPFIDQYLKGELSERDFLSRVSWKKTWGFPWENYRPLFKWAQANKSKIYGINTKSKADKLQDRDRLSAEMIAKIKSKNPTAKILVQYGDFHIASQHLPRQLKKQCPKSDQCVVYQSPEVLYFKIMEKQKELSTDVVRLTEDKWALNVLPPWVKWQDYLLYLESGQDKRIAISEVDPTDSVSHAVQLLSKSFGLKVDTSSLSVYSAGDDAFFDQVEELPRAVRQRVLESLQDGQSFYVPEKQMGYVARLSVNHVTKVAAQYIYFKEGGFDQTLVDPKKDFLKFIWLEGVTYLCSKVSNPKRKTDTLQDIREALQKEQFDDRGKEALMLSLSQKLSELNFISSQRMPSGQKKTLFSRKSYLMSAQILGGILGEKFFYALTKKLIRFPTNKNLIFRNLSSPQFSKIYYESLETIESWPVLFKSKYDKL